MAGNSNGNMSMNVGVGGNTNGPKHTVLSIGAPVDVRMNDLHLTRIYTMLKKNNISGRYFGFVGNKRYTNNFSKLGNLSPKTGIIEVVDNEDIPMITKLLGEINVKVVATENDEKFGIKCILICIDFSKIDMM